VPEAKRNGFDLASAWTILQRREPQLRQREAAARLGVTEADLVDSQVGRAAVRLDGRWIDLLAGVRGLGRVKAITRNEHAVIESWGRYLDLSKPWRRQPHDQRMNLQLFLEEWHAGFALLEVSPERVQRSIQFFDGGGTAVHKIYLLDDDVGPLWDRWVAGHLGQPAVPQPIRRVRRRHPAPVDGDETDDAEWTRPASATAHRQILETCRDQRLPVQITVGNRGLCQVHTEVPVRVAASGPWWNVLDTSWNFHLRERAIARALVVRRAEPRRLVTRLELFDDADEPIAALAAPPGAEDRRDWLALMAAVEVRQ
jgi:putative hemin transport protein